MALTEDVSNDLFHLLCGDIVGEGQFRQVYEHHFDESLVVKYDHGKEWCNVSEYIIWNEFRGTALEKWLAPVHWLSPRGFWLIQSKTTAIPVGSYPKRVPSIFADIKPSNWGMLDGRPVCHDYGNHAIFTHALKDKIQMQRVVWEHHRR